MPLSTLSYGFEKPSNPTYGDLFWPAMERNIQRMNDHTHNGTNSARIAATTAEVLSAAWGSDLGGGTYRQTITCPAGFTFDTCRIEVRRDTGEVVYPKLVRVTSTTFYIYTNDNTAGYTISYV